MRNGLAPDGYSPVVEAFSGGVQVCIYAALAAIGVLLVVSTVRRFAAV